MQWTHWKVRIKLATSTERMSGRKKWLFWFPHPIFFFFSVRAKSHDFNFAIDWKRANWWKKTIAIIGNERNRAHDRVLNLGACLLHALLKRGLVIYFFHFVFALTVVANVCCLCYWWRWLVYHRANKIKSEYAYIIRKYVSFRLECINRSLVCRFFLLSSSFKILCFRFGIASSYGLVSQYAKNFSKLNA